MSWTLRLIALAIVIASTAGPLHAEEGVGPPAWKDGGSVYLAMSQKAAADGTTTSQAPVESAAPTATTTMPIEVPTVVDPELGSAANEAPFSAKPANRYLAPPSSRHVSSRTGTTGDQDSQASAASRRLAEFGVPMQSIYTILSALAIVIGVFLLFTWVLRRGGRAMASRGQLPADVVNVLGRVPLGARQFAELLRVGNKLVLVSLTPTGAETLTEVTDAAEVDRLVGLCQQSNPFSTTKAFEQVFQQMSTEPAPAGFLGNEAMLTSFASPAGAYRANRGGGARG